MIGRRSLIVGGAGLLAGCDRVLEVPKAREVLFAGERFQQGLHRALSDRGALAPEYRADQRSPVFRTNGTRDPGTPEYAALAAGGFADWRLCVDGLVDRPLALSLAQLRSMPARSQITRHDCVEGWSAIGGWTGPQLRTVLDAAGVRSTARYIVFRCADLYRGTPYYESVDMVDARHPQTLVALALNGRPLGVGHGAPARLRVERQLGYKHAKYLMQITAVAGLDRIGRGKGGYWEDYHDYDWYAGI
jgi:DMSO/TMAO reductase YedYZ molybdopterin-dependent catalytic subunit